MSVIISQSQGAMERGLKSAGRKAEARGALSQRLDAVQSLERGAPAVQHRTSRHGTVPNLGWAKWQTLAARDAPQLLSVPMRTRASRSAPFRLDAARVDGADAHAPQFESRSVAERQYRPISISTRRPEWFSPDECAKSRSRGERADLAVWAYVFHRYLRLPGALVLRLRRPPHGRDGGGRARLRRTAGA